MFSHISIFNIHQACPRARIRATTRASRKMEDGALGDTLGDKARGMVVVDFDGHPQKFDQMEILSQFVAKEVNVLKVNVPRAGGKGWKRTNSEIETQDTDLGNNWCEELSAGAEYVVKETWVKASGPNDFRALVCAMLCCVFAIR